MVGITHQSTGMAIPVAAEPEATADTSAVLAPMATTAPRAPAAATRRANPATPTTPDRLDGPFADPLVGRLFGPLATGAHWGLDRVSAALKVIGDPHLACPVIHVGGTNGKGSVATMVASVLRASGMRSACYTSPHLCSIRERMLVGGEPFSEEELVEVAAEARGPVMEHGLTFFEATTVMAFLAFARAEADVAVIEVGLGGRLDATNVVRPEVAAITNIAMDHAEYLGGKLETIAREKAGIAKAGVPLATAEHRPHIVSLFREVAGSLGAPFSALDPGSVGPVEVRPSGTRFSSDTESWGSLALETPLVGRHQATNAALAVHVLDLLPKALRPPADAVVEGIRSVEYHGRNQIEQVNGVTWLFDGAHNTAGMASLADTVDRLPLAKPLVALVGVLGDKDWRAMLPPLLQLVDLAILTQPPSASPERRWSIPEVASALAGQEGATGIVVEEDFQRALDLADSVARGSGVEGGSVIVAGSIYTVGSALGELGMEPLAASVPPLGVR